MRSDLIRTLDGNRNSALHYAASKDYRWAVMFILRADPSLAYLANLAGQSPLHVAAANGRVHAIEELLYYYPDSAEQLDDMGRNVLHIAVMSGKVDSLKCLLKDIEPEEIINQGDIAGNTPLHLAVRHAREKSSIQLLLILLNDKRVDPFIANEEGLTARSGIERTDKITPFEVQIGNTIRKYEIQWSKNQLQQQQQQHEARITLTSLETWSIDNFKSRADTYTLVAALIATVTFAATFTVPGGYNQENGKAIFAKQTAFKAFMISNTIAMCSSLIVVLCFIWAWKDPVGFTINQLKWGHRLTVVACQAMLVALMMSVYQVVADDCLWVAIMVCVICCSAPFILGAILGHKVFFFPL